MDLFKKSYNDKATNYDFYDGALSKNNSKLRNKEKKILHKLARARMKKIDKKYNEWGWQNPERGLYYNCREVKKC